MHPAGSAAEWSKTGKIRCLLREIAQRAIRFLDAPQLFTDFAAINLFCRSRLIETGLARPSGRLYLDRLTEAAESALRQLRSVYPEANGIDWLLAMGRKHRHSFSALQHILFELVLEAAPAQSPKRKAPKPRKFLANNPTFEVRLRSAAAKAMGLRAAARAVGVDPRTIQRHATRLGLDSPWKKVEAEKRREPPTDRETDSKQRWLRAVESGMNRKGLRSVNSADWTWLKRRHPRWLEEHSPDAIQRSAPKPRKDWSDIDAAIAPSITAAASVIRRRVPPSRITMAAIERELGRQGWFSPRLRKLPLCKETLAEEKEDLEAFQLRRVVWARETLLANCESAQPWQVHRLAGLPKKVSRRIASAVRGGSAQ